MKDRYLAYPGVQSGCPKRSRHRRRCLFAKLLLGYLNQGSLISHPFAADTSATSGWVQLHRVDSCLATVSPPYELSCPQLANETLVVVLVLLETLSVFLVERCQAQGPSWKRLDAPQYVRCDGVLVTLPERHPVANSCRLDFRVVSFEPLPGASQCGAPTASLCLLTAPSRWPASVLQGQSSSFSGFVSPEALRRWRASSSSPFVHQIQVVYSLCTGSSQPQSKEPDPKPIAQGPDDDPHLSLHPRSRRWLE